MSCIESSPTSARLVITSYSIHYTKLYDYKDNDPDEEGLKAFARLQVNEMERGLFVLEIVIAAAPLIGLLGTVTGLVGVFSGFSETTGMPDPGAFVKGIALALSTTVLGLSIAIPALVGNALLMRRVESLAAKLEVVITSYSIHYTKLYE